MKGTETLKSSRTYSIPFEDVWQGALRIIREKSKGWVLDTADDQEGLITAGVRGLHKKLNGLVEVRIVLDEDGQTRVAGHFSTPDAFSDFGVNARRMEHFFTGLDREAEREWQRRLATGR
jgi:hypothetical protein